MKKDEKKMKKVLRSRCNLSLCPYRQRETNKLTNMKTIKKHKAVSFYDKGWNQDSDYKHYVELKEGWKFTDGRMEGGSSLFFNTLADFKLANPKPIN